MKYKSKKIIAIIVVIAVAFGAYQIHAKKDQANKDNAVKFVKPTTGSIEESITAQGKLESKEYVDVGTQVSGQLKKIYFDAGANVKKGDLLAEIDDSTYTSKVDADKARLNTLQAQLAQQQAQIVLAQQQHDRNLNLIKSQAISQEAVDESTSALAVAKAGGDSLKAQINEAQSTLQGDQANLGYTKIYAPQDGTITSETAMEGQTLNANQTAPIILRIENLDIMTVSAQVAEADVMRLHEGMDAYFTVLGSQERKWKGKLRQILPAPQTVNDVVLYIALIDIDNKDRQLMTGMSAQVFFVIGNADKTMLIPTSALGKHLVDKDNETGSAYEVNVRSGRGMTTKTVYIGLGSRGKSQVVSGLTADDEVEAVETKPAPAAGSGGGKGFRGGPRI